MEDLTPENNRRGQDGAYLTNLACHGERHRLIDEGRARHRSEIKGEITESIWSTLWKPEMLDFILRRTSGVGKHQSTNAGCRGICRKAFNEVFKARRTPSFIGLTAVRSWHARLVARILTFVRSLLKVSGLPCMQPNLESTITTNGALTKLMLSQALLLCHDILQKERGVMLYGFRR